MPLSETTPNWDELYLEKNTPWDKGSAAPPLLEWIENHPGMIRGRILVPGSGMGHDVRALAALTEAEEVVGLDLSPTAVSLASGMPGPEGSRHLVGNLLELAPEHRGTYDWVWEHTCFCAIDPAQRSTYVESVHAALAPGGRILGVFYRNPYDDEHQPGGGPPHGTTIEELNARFMESGRFQIEESYVPARSYPGREGLEQVVRMRRL